MSVPLTVYLDTALWYDLADGNVPAKPFESAIHKEIILPVFSFIHLIEFAQCEVTSRNRVTSYIDSLVPPGRARWIKTLPVVAEEELIKSFLTFQGMTPGPINVFADSLVDTLKSTVQGLDRAEARTYDMTSLVAIMNGIPQFRRHQRFRATRALWDIVQLQFQRAREGRSTDPFHSEYVQNTLADMPRRIVTPAGLLIDVTPALRGDFIRQLRWDEIPAITLRIALMNGWSLGLGGAKASDFEDLFHIATAIAYCDVAFSDRRVYAALQKGGAAKLPKRNSEFPTWCATLA